MSNEFGRALRIFRNTHCYDATTHAIKPWDPVVTGALKGLSQEFIAERANIDVRTIRNVEKGLPAERPTIARIVHVMASDTLVEQSLLALYAGKEPVNHGSRRFIFVIVPALANSLFWTDLVSSAIRKVSAVDGAPAPGTARHADEPTFAIVPMTTEESLERLRAFLSFAHTSIDNTYAVLIAPACGLQEEAETQDALVAEIQDLLTTFRQTGVPIVFLDRHLPQRGGNPETYWQTIPRPESWTYPPGIVWVGVNNLEAGRHVADTVLSALRRAGRPPEESRIGVVIDEVRLTSQSQRWLAIRDTMRTAGIHDEGPHPRLMFGAARIGAGSADDMDPNYWGLAERIDSILAERPDVLLCGSSSVARTAHAAARERCPRSASPVIVSLDGAIEDRMLGWERPVAFLRYRPRELVDKVFEILGNWSAYKERGQHITLDVSMHGTSVLEQAIAALPAASESFQVGQLMESSGQPRSVCRRRSPLSGSARATRRRRGLARVHDRGAPI